MTSDLSRVKHREFYLYCRFAEAGSARAAHRMSGSSGHELGACFKTPPHSYERIASMTLFENVISGGNFHGNRSMVKQTGSFPTEYCNHNVPKGTHEPQREELGPRSVSPFVRRL
jgi:hypothetical protein